MANSRNRNQLRNALATKAETLLKRPAVQAGGESGVAASKHPPAESAPIAAVAAAAAPVAAAPGVAATGVLLPSALLINDVREFAGTLRDAVQHGDVTVDVAPLGDIDTAGLQLLCVTRAAVLAAGHAFVWKGDSQVLSTAAGSIGLTQALGLAA
jgi:hypothetical protein